MNRDELVERVRELIAEAATCGDPECETCTQAARAALAIIEPAVREECARVADARFVHWSKMTGAISPSIVAAAGEDAAAAIRAGAKPT